MQRIWAPIEQLAALNAIDDCGFMGHVFRYGFRRQNGLCAMRCIRKAAKLLAFGNDRQPLGRPVSGHWG